MVVSNYLLYTQIMQCTHNNKKNLNHHNIIPGNYFSAEGHQSVDRFLAQENRWEVHNNWNTPTYSLATVIFMHIHEI